VRRRFDERGHRVVGGRTGPDDNGVDRWRRRNGAVARPIDGRELYALQAHGELTLECFRRFGALGSRAYYLQYRRWGPFFIGEKGGDPLCLEL
jgi:hypothetical protein